MSFFYIKVSLSFHWGYLIRKYTASKTRESYLVPPPTTLIGALAYGYAKLKNLPEEDTGYICYDCSTAERIRKQIISVNTKLLSRIILYADLTRIWWFRKRESIAKMDAVAIGKTYVGKLNTAKDMEVVYVFSNDIKEEEKRNLVKAAYSIIRIGGSHGLVSVIDVDYGTASKLVGENTVHTQFSTWGDIVSVQEEVPLLRELVVDYKRVGKMGDYSGAPYREHLYMYRVDRLEPVKVEVKLEGGALPIKIGDEVVVIERQ
ncbi:type I-A CRISPR-associated protein Cas5a [Infirmifilum sp.]|uniref:type I-A CRISPR-associated protein Cas5a n=1 Tax=Infirmifilum sp. TaxID=2856575 RepID=UPI003D12C850